MKCHGEVLKMGIFFNGNYQSHRLGNFLMAPTHDNHPFVKVVVSTFITISFNPTHKSPTKL